MKKILFIIAILFSCIVSIISQEIVKEITTYNYNINSNRYSIFTMKLSNCSNENIYIWFEKGNLQDSDQYKKIKFYFFKRKGDFSLIQLATEEFSASPSTIIFNTFVKKITPKDSFSIVINHKDAKCNDLKKVSSSEINHFFHNNVVIAKESDLTSLFNVDILTPFFYKSKSINIAWDDISSAIQDIDQ